MSDGIFVSLLPLVQPETSAQAGSGCSRDQETRGVTAPIPDGLTNCVCYMTKQAKLEIVRQSHNSQGSGAHFLSNYCILKGKMYFEGQAMGQLSTLQRAKEHHGNKQQELQGSLKRQKHFKICE